MTDAWWDYVQKISQKSRPADIAERTQISAPTISRWNPENKGGPARPDPDNVVRFAREYNRSPLEALIIAGYITVDDIGKPVQLPGSAKDMTDRALVEALADRLAELRGRLTGDEGEGWSSAGWSAEDPGVGRVQDGD
jgi:transcriptional regulator with XRE-family HTH domain